MQSDLGELVNDLGELANKILSYWVAMGNFEFWMVDQNNYRLNDLVFFFVLWFYSPVNTMGSCQAQSVYPTTLLLGRLSPLSS